MNEASTSPDTGPATCMHERLRFNSGDYYVTCCGCHATWMRKSRGTRPEHGYDSQGRVIGAAPEEANQGSGSSLSGHLRVRLVDAQIPDDNLTEWCREHPDFAADNIRLLQQEVAALGTTGAVEAKIAKLEHQIERLKDDKETLATGWESDLDRLAAPSAELDPDTVERCAKAISDQRQIHRYGHVMTPWGDNAMADSFRREQIELAQAAIRALCASKPDPSTDSAWQPIETVPKNHFPILLYGKYGTLVGFQDVTWEWWPFPAHEALGYTPTHWMPLPARPQSQTDRG